MKTFPGGCSNECWILHLAVSKSKQLVRGGRPFPIFAQGLENELFISQSWRMMGEQRDTVLPPNRLNVVESRLLPADVQQLQPIRKGLHLGA
ncbi:hypothetical protein [Anatilimnocola floriformis]|uniref:hypothetical protein n=1 Tax=Anatilimnocola floriformis TaxID=2948575 RepID=UPI0020C4971C|nr:hypothetical protein [Anatilimnocola floriformis]